jgi:hypothetical protein
MKKFLAGLILGLGFIGTGAYALSISLPFQGGTGTSAIPTYGQILVGNSSGTYTLTATSSLGITSASSTLLSDLNFWSKLQIFNGNATTTQLTATDLWISSLSSGRIPYSGTGGRIFTSSGLQFDDSINKITVTYASTTAISSSYSSSTAYVAGDLTIPHITNTFLASDNNGKVIATTTAFAGLTAIPNGHIYPQMASSSLSAGNIDIYTVPAGKKSIIMATSFYNPTGSTITVQPMIKSRGVYYPIVNSVGITTHVNTSSGNSVILEQGETLSASSSSSGLVSFPKITEFNNSPALPFFTATSSITANTMTVLYTSPTNTYTTNSLLSLPNNNVSNIICSNINAPSAAFAPYLVTAGGLMMQISATSSAISTSNVGATAGLVVNLSPGDSLKILSTGDIFCWVNLINQQ